MSGIVGLIQTGAEPIDRTLFERMVSAIDFRGPDASHTVYAGRAAFGHTLLRLHRRQSRQPLWMADRFLMTADARLDGRQSLRRKLEDEGIRHRDPVSDERLILDAFVAWGEGCLEHLVGDFAFALWDAELRRLFCARDQLGVKPLYYFHREKTFGFSNTLDALRLHSAVSTRLNDQAIADFLLFGLNHQLDSTTFADVHRLPPACWLSLQNGICTTRRYWSLPVGEEVRYRHSGDYVRQFTDFFECAVRDRLSEKEAGIYLSGGLDSGSVAAVAAEQIGASELTAYTTFYNRRVKDEEQKYARLTAHWLGMAIEVIEVDDYRLYEGWDRADLRRPEPYDNPFSQIERDLLERVASGRRLALTGQGGDVCLRARFPDLMRDLRDPKAVRRVVNDLFHYTVAFRKFPPVNLSRRLLHWWRRLLPPERWRYPEWLNPEFEQRLGLPERWEELSAPPTPSTGQRPAHLILANADWPAYFEELDPGATGFPVEFAHPIFDLRLLEFLAAIPVVPWLADKEILRQAMKSRLPEPVRRRPKVPLGGNTTAQMLAEGGKDWVSQLDGVLPLEEYVDVKAVKPRLLSERPRSELTAWLDLRPVSLAFWLRSLQQKR